MICYVIKPPSDCNIKLLSPSCIDQFTVMVSYLTHLLINVILLLILSFCVPCSAPLSPFSPLSFILKMAVHFPTYFIWYHPIWRGLYLIFYTESLRNESWQSTCTCPVQSVCLTLFSFTRSNTFQLFHDAVRCCGHCHTCHLHQSC